MNRKVLLAVIIIVVVAASIVVNRVGDRKDNGVLTASGTVEVTEADLGFKIPGRVVSLFIEEGQRMNAGDRLASLDSAELRSNAAQNKATVTYAEAEAEKARKDNERYQKLIESGAIPVQQMDAARTAYDMAAARLRQAQAAHLASQERLRDTELFAPMNGVVLRKNVEAGETVATGAAVLTLGDLDSPWVKVYVKEDKLGLVKLGQKAEVTVDSFPGKKYEGTVTYISSEAEFTPKNVQTQEERVKLVFSLKVSVRNQNSELKPGMPADVKILLK